MEEIEIRDAIRRHVTSGEPPLGLNVHQLLTQGRQRQQWRIGLGLGSGTAALLLASTLTLVPLGGGGPAPRNCSLPLASGWAPVPSAPVLPTVARPSGSPVASLDPMFGGPSSDPTPNASVAPTETAVAPTDGPSVTPTDGPGASFQPTERPLDPPPTMQALPAKVTAADCYLAKRLRELFPDATFAPVGNQGTFQFHAGTSFYIASGVIVLGKDALQLDVYLEQDVPFPDGDRDPWQRGTVNGLLMRTDRFDYDILSIEVYSTHTTRIGMVAGKGMTERQLAELLAGPELDIFS